MKILDYQIYSGEHDFVVKRVQEHIAKGYVPYGDMQMSTFLDMSTVRSVFAQAMVKYETDRPETSLGATVVGIQ